MDDDEFTLDTRQMTCDPCLLITMANFVNSNSTTTLQVQRKGVTRKPIIGCSRLAPSTETSQCDYVHCYHMYQDIFVPDLPLYSKLCGGGGQGIWL